MQLHDLYKKVQQFESALSEQSLSRLSCKVGCSRCCYVDLSVFEVEAAHIRGWFDALSGEEKNKLREVWQRPSTEILNFHGKLASACPFLREEACTIYEARPLICRTQGLPMKFKDEESLLLDVCPLNEEVLEVIHESEILNLDLINLILGQLEKLDAHGQLRQRVRLSDLFASFQAAQPAV